MDELEIYTSLEDAKAEIQRRWGDKDLRKKVEEFLGGDIPEPFKNEPRAVLFRNIISPDIEFYHFLDMAKEMGIKPLGLEYVNDKFCTRNEDKLCLGKLAIFEKRDKNGNAIVHFEKIIDIKASDNKRFSDIKTLQKEGLVEFHHNLLKYNSKENVDTCDMSEWIERNGHAAVEYYKKFLAFFICHGVLFENFLFDGEEDAFTKETFIPAFELVTEKFNLKPMILPAIAIENIGDKYWWCYPELVKK